MFCEAQRYSFILNSNQPVGNYCVLSSYPRVLSKEVTSYWTGIRSLPDRGVGSNTFNGGLNSAILRYAGAPIQDPTTTSSVSNPLVETNLHVRN